MSHEMVAVSGATAEQRRYVAFETALAVLINSLLSLVFGLALSQGVERVPVRGMHGAAMDFFPQVFMITFATTLVTTLLTRKRIRAGKVAAMRGGRAGLLKDAPRPALVRAVLLALVLALVLAPLSATVLYIGGFDSIPVSVFLVMKVVYGAVLASVIAPPVIRSAMEGEA